MKYVTVALALSLSLINFNSFAVNVNTANSDQLSAELKGVGPSLAQKIIDYRDENGVITSVDELVKVKGIGRNVIENNLDKLEFDSTAQLSSD